MQYILDFALFIFHLDCCSDLCAFAYLFSFFFIFVNIINAYRLTCRYRDEKLTRMCSDHFLDKEQWQNFFFFFFFFRVTCQKKTQKDENVIDNDLCSLISMISFLFFSLFDSAKCKNQIQRIESFLFFCRRCSTIRSKANRSTVKEDQLDSLNN